MRLGAHVSVAGGLQNAIPWALEIEADTFQMFSKNQRQWIAKPLTEEQIEEFKKPLSETDLGPLMIHDSYLINMGSPDETKGKRAQIAFLEVCTAGRILRMVSESTFSIGNEIPYFSDVCDLSTSKSQSSLS